MKLTERIELLDHQYGPVSHHKEGYSISDKPIDDFITKLKEKGIIIDVNASEKEVGYHSQRKGEYKNVTVPLGTTFPEDDGFVIAYFLQGAGEDDSRHVKYELELKDHKAVGRTNRIGGSVAGEYGIVCTVTAEGSKVDASIADSVRKALHETYIPPVVLSEQQKKDLADFKRQVDKELKKRRKK